MPEFPWKRGTRKGSSFGKATNKVESAASGMGALCVSPHIHNYFVGRFSYWKLTWLGGGMDYNGEHMPLLDPLCFVVTFRMLHANIVDVDITTLKHLMCCAIKSVVHVSSSFLH